MSNEGETGAGDTGPGGASLRQHGLQPLLPIRLPPRASAAAAAAAASSPPASPSIPEDTPPPSQERRTPSAQPSPESTGHGGEFGQEEEEERRRRELRVNVGRLRKAACRLRRWRAHDPSSGRFA